MRHLTVLASRMGLMGVVIRAAQNDPGLSNALFDAVSAHHAYSHVVSDTITLNAIRSLLSALFTGQPKNMVTHKK